ncbi:putative retrotransposon hot spot (RHS) protein [Trypanosoma grayi]|uniref:putative retrotransposon hot spot (RHS) protein n=1 Tax=Trypanosoma grayi TaxID=71804 RepID=UPI0004F403F3|nr:putative retrotransposon hot spot (RHS) protein [Trypanosoma grayi]KEG13826.1 putative retrotransposon hot spot (RHS) protein [Trypanosoma grayi]
MTVTSRRVSAMPQAGKTRSSKRVKAGTLTKSEGTHGSYAGLVLNLAACVDTLANFSLIPIVALQSEAIPLSRATLALAQSFVFFPQLWSTPIAERFARRVGGFAAYAATLLATAVSIFLSAMALREGSLYLFLAARIVNGLFRHIRIFGTLAMQELPLAAKGLDVKRVTTFSLPAAMIFGGALGDYGDGVASVSLLMAAIELAIAVLVGLLSFKVVRKSKTIPAVQTVNAYKKWLLRRRYHEFAVFIPVALTTLCASMNQCMYPFTDRRAFHLDFFVVGIHMAVVITTPIIFAPFLVKWCTDMTHLMIHASAVLLVVGASISPCVAENGIAFYFFTTWLLTDLPAAVLESALCPRVVDNFSVAEQPFAEKLLLHVRQTFKQWSAVLLVFMQAVFDNRSDVMRVATAPLALGVLVFTTTRRVTATMFTVVFVHCVLGWLSPADNNDTWNSIIALARSWLPLLLRGHSDISE